MPQLTVLMTVYNGMPYLPHAIESVLTQSFNDFELLVVDDGSSDGSSDILCGYDDPRLRLLRNEANVGQTASLNFGLAAAETDLVARMDQDDICHRDRLRKQVEFLAVHSEIAVLGTGVRWIDSSGVVIGKKNFPYRNAVARFAQFFRCPLAHGSVAFRRQVVWDELGGYDPSIRFSQDWELWGRVLACHEIANLIEPLVDVRIHDTSTTAKHHHEIVAEDERVYCLSLGALLGVEAVPKEWIRLIGELAAIEIESCVEHIDMADTIYKLYIEKHPEVAADAGVLVELARHYGRLVRHGRGSVVQRCYSVLLAGGKFARHCLTRTGRAG